MNEFSFDHDILSNFDIQMRDSASICGLLVSLLCFSDSVMEFLVKFIKVNSKFLSSVRGEILFWIDSDTSIIFLVGKER
jgi:hypothetical protein